MNCTRGNMCVHTLVASTSSFKFFISVIIAGIWFACFLICSLLGSLHNLLAFGSVHSFLGSAQMSRSFLENAFIDTLYHQYLCNICIRPCRDPYLTTGCGHHCCLDDNWKMTIPCTCCCSKNFITVASWLRDKEFWCDVYKQGEWLWVTGWTEWYQ